MASVFEEVIDDLAEEHRALERVLERLAPSVFEQPTHAIGWAVRDQVAHLAHFDEAAALAITDAEALREHFRRPENGEPAYLERARTLAHGDLLEWWRTASGNLRAALKSLDPAARIPWAGPPMSGVSHVTARLMETWSHGLDVVDVAGVERPDTDRLRHVAFLGVRTRPYSYQTRNLEPSRVPVRVSLTAPSGATWELGDDTNENVVRGSATDFCRVVTQRRHIADTSLEVIGEAAREWMGIAQAFAGPPGAGRQPGEFPREAKR
ncbi:MAG: TIGR03084 family protein [Dehalococcoidia bacterium]|nr:TIGR03084 family protein [Dehalococcoidia bacterium]